MLPSKACYKRMFWTVTIALMTIIISCASMFQQVREMPIQDVDLNQIKDGIYTGAFNYGFGGGYTYKVQTTIRHHRMEGIRVLQNRDTEYAKKAEEVLLKILSSQTPNVDAISGATTTSKALMKAVENSLLQPEQIE